MGRTVLSYRVEPSDANRIVTATDAISELTRRRGWYVRIGNYTETFCQRCGEPSYGVMSTPWHRFHSAIASTSPRIAGVLNAAKAFLRRRPPFEDAAGNINIPLLLSRVRFPVYGLRGERSGLRLRELSWVGQGNGRRIDRVRFLYAASGEGGPERAIALTQGVEVGDATAADRLFSELQAIVGLVTSHGSEALRREYRRSGNVHRDWNLVGLHSAGKRRLNVTIGGRPMEVEFAYWSKPESVTLAYAARDGHTILATSVGMSHVALLALFKTMAVLQMDPEAQADHQQGYEEARVIVNPLSIQR